MLIWENVTEVAKEQKDQPSHLDVIQECWEEISYKSILNWTNATSHALPQDRKRLVALAADVREPRTFNFLGRMPEPHQRHLDWPECHWAFNVFETLFGLCQQDHGCASEFLLPADDPHVLQELTRRQEVAKTRKHEGYDQKKAMDELKKINIDYAEVFTGPAHESRQALLGTSPWVETLTYVERDRLEVCMYRDNIRQSKSSDEIYFRDCHPGFGRDRVSSRTPDGRVVINSMMPSQLTFTFDRDNPNHVPRIMLGRESLHLCGFPWDIINSVTCGDQPFSETSMQSLAGNMLAVPVFLAAVLSALCSARMVVASGDEESPALDSDLCERDEKSLALDSDLCEIEDILKLAEEDEEGGRAEAEEVSVPVAKRPKIYGVMQTQFLPVTALHVLP